VRPVWEEDRIGRVRVALEDDDGGGGKGSTKISMPPPMEERDCRELVAGFFGGG
jgi:hypothetical protein